MKRLWICCLLAMAVTQHSMAATQGEDSNVEGKFRQFLTEYWEQIEARNADYLRVVHPKLPAVAYDLFFDVTRNMMQFAEKNEALEPKIECQDFNVCKVVYPQPNDSWAAQRFILHEGAWRWLDQ